MFFTRVVNQRCTTLHALKRNSSKAFAGVLMATATTLLIPVAEARVTKLEITETKDAFGGYVFPIAGKFQRLTGVIYGELNPNAPLNSKITDIKLAPKTSNGNVAYKSTFYILRPADLTKSNGKTIWGMANRGGVGGTGMLRLTGGNDPASTSANLADVFALPQGWSFINFGYDQSAGEFGSGSATFNQTIDLPVAVNANGSVITGPAYEYISMGNSTTKTSSLTYPAANTTDKTTPKLTQRKLLNDTPVVVPASGWEYVDENTIGLTGGATFAANEIYEFEYTAKNPTVNGIGFAAARDILDFFKNATADDAGTLNPLKGAAKIVVTINTSLPSRWINQFVTLGFNQTETGRRAIDGAENWIGAFNGVQANVRFGYPGSTRRNRQQLQYPEGTFPFSFTRSFDPISGKTAGRMDECETTATCPFILNPFSANEVAVKPASLGTTDTTGGLDLPDHPMVRNYLFTGMQHGSGNAAGNCDALQNNTDQNPALRALFVALDQWITNGTEPPPSAVPKLADGTYVPPFPQSGVGFPNIPGVRYTPNLFSTTYYFNLGPRYETEGIMDNFPPHLVAPFFNNPANGPIYPQFVEKTDADGNGIAGVRMWNVAVPLATYRGSALRNATAGDGEGCEGSGSRFPFPKTKADRIATGDPRLSIEERYPSFTGYYYMLAAAINDLVARRFMLGDDAFREFNRGLLALQATGLYKNAMTVDVE
jgi:hypothetical protein